MKPIGTFALFASIFLSFQTFAEIQTVSCTGLARSGKTYKINFQADEKSAVFSSQGIKRFSEVQVRLQEIGKSGRTLNDHREIVKDFTFMPSVTKPTIYQFIASGTQRIFIAARPEGGLLRSTVQIDVGRFRGIVLDEANCKVDGEFTEVKDTVDEIAKKYGISLEPQSTNGRIPAKENSNTETAQ